MLTEQKSTSKRFFQTITTEAANICSDCRQDAEHWLNGVLLPIFQNVQEQKQFLEEQIIQLKALASEKKDAQAKAMQLKKLVKLLDLQLQEAEDILSKLKQPAPFEAKKPSPIEQPARPQQ